MHAGAAAAAAHHARAMRHKRYRTNFTQWQLHMLEREFDGNRGYADTEQRRDIATRLNLPEATVRIWFQNRRAKQKKGVGYGQMMEIGKDEVDDAT